ncbi:MAG: hypothetical protein PHN19_02890 [Patescibacteria group bacterium]|nr:hypothetical protein [Patescibacteria group bacterium]
MTKKISENKNSNKEIEKAWQEFLIEMNKLKKEQNKIVKDFEKKLIAAKKKKIINKIN